MSIQIIWEDKQKSVMRQVFSGRWTVEEYRRSVEKTQKLLKGLPHTVHIIVDLRESEGTPSNILSAARFADAQMPDNLGMVMIVNADAFDRTIVSMAERIAPRLLHQHSYAHTIDEALARIAQTQSKACSQKVPAL